MSSHRAIPASALNEDDDEDEDGVVGDMRDDERTGTRYNVSIFLVALALFDVYSLCSTVLVVPRYLCYWCDVCRYASH